MRGTFSFLNGGFSKNVIIIGTDMRTSVHVGMLIIKKDILILPRSLTLRLGDTTLIADTE